MSRNPFLQDICRRIVQTTVVLTGVLLALEILNATALVGGVLGAAGVAGIAIGFAFRDLVENYIASILLSVRQPFRPRDHVLIDGHEGLVTSMNSRTTVLTTFDGNIVRLPNAIVFKSALTNYSTDPRRRFTFDVGVGYDVDLAEAINVGVEVLRGTEGVLSDPAPFAIVTRLGDSSITVSLFGWVNQPRERFRQGQEPPVCSESRQSTTDAISTCRSRSTRSSWAVRCPGRARPRRDGPRTAEGGRNAVQRPDPLRHHPPIRSCTMSDAIGSQNRSPPPRSGSRTPRICWTRRPPRNETNPRTAPPPVARAA
ncbi:MAG: mechanosensitive ion channel family protein [Planctomycetota bacterium]|nr:MAG: mechanosensitive ion channel family protein [Planctomycetota bacterium]